MIYITMVWYPRGDRSAEWHAIAGCDDRWTGQQDGWCDEMTDVKMRMTSARSLFYCSLCR
jgi:hypothetical protein